MVLMATFGQPSHEDPTHVQLAVVPHSTSPLAGLDLQQRQVGTGGDWTDVVVVCRIIAERRNSLGENGVRQLRQWVQRRQLARLQKSPRVR